MPPRENYLSWDEYFMGIALLSGQRSKDPNRQVGACIVDKKNRIMGIGYNGFPRGCPDYDLPWTGKEKLVDPDVDMVLAINDKNLLDTKYPYVCHAEANAILNCHSRDLETCTIYVALFPCNECTKLIIQSGIVRVVYLSDKNHDHPVWEASRKMLDMANVKYQAFEGCRATDIRLSLAKDVSLPKRVPKACSPSYLPAALCGMMAGILLTVAYQRVVSLQRK